MLRNEHVNIPVYSLVALTRKFIHIFHMYSYVECSVLYLSQNWFWEIYQGMVDTINFIPVMFYVKLL